MPVRPGFSLPVRSCSHGLCDRLGYDCPRSFVWSKMGWQVLSQGIPKEFWDDRFSEDGFAYGDRPSRLLLAWADVIRSNCKSALVPACGEGRDAVFLAELGLQVTALDISIKGLEKTRHLAASRNVSVETIEADLFKWDWPENRFDVVATMFGHMPSAVRPDLHSRYKQSLTPGGFVFLEGFTQDQLTFQKSHNSGGPPDLDMLYTVQSVRSEFGGLDELSLMTGTETLEEGPYHTGPSALIRAVYQKPMDKQD